MAEKIGKQWAILVAGAKTWDNYGLQANICHAYQIVHQNGIPDEQIVVMMYDDIAYNDLNPYQGNIINEPDGSNVYPGVPKDYTGNDVTPENFLAALRGDEKAVTKSGPKKVIKSGKNDTIFVFLSDHGGPGLFCFPNSSLYAIDFIEAIEDMARKQQFSKMVIFMECCYSGSMLECLPENISVYGVSASEPDQVAYFCYYDEERNTFLAAQMSAVWMSFTETSDLDKITFQDEFQHLEKNVESSTPCQFGDEKVSRLPVSLFLKNVPSSVLKSRSIQKPTHLVPYFDAPSRILERRIESENDPVKKNALKKEYDDLQQTKVQIEQVFEEIYEHYSPLGPLTAWSKPLNRTQLHHLKTLSEFFRTNFFNWHEAKFEYALSQIHVFARLCAAGLDVERIMENMKTVKEILPVFHPAAEPMTV